MSNIRDLFSKKLHVSKVETDKAEVESKEYIAEKKIEREEFVPPIDFATASNYIRFGSAKEYYASSIQRIYNMYPYDGSEKEKIEFRNNSTELDKWIFDYKYPKASGHAAFDATSYIVVNRGYKEATVPASSKLSKLFDLKSVKHDEDKRRRETIEVKLDDGLTLEWWMNRDNNNSTNEGIYTILSDNESRITISARTHATDPGIKLVWYNSVTADSFGGATNEIISHSELDENAIIDGQWHHHAVSFYRESNVVYCDFYYDGVFKQKTTIGAGFADFTGNITLYIGVSAEYAGSITPP
jgi:hypothetical protein